MTISGCSNNLVKTKEVAILPEDSLLLSSCKPQSEFTTPREMGELFIENFYCIEAYEVKLQSLRDWKLKQEKIYNVK